MSNGPKRFIECLLPVTSCNLLCEYCYIIQEKRRSNDVPSLKYPIHQIIESLNLERMGGVCFFSICGAGETLIPSYIVDLVHGLLEEGHYVNITTNGTLTKRFSELVNFDSNLLKHLHFAFSFHYCELKKHNLVDVFFNNVDLVKKAGCSFVVQINLYDGYLPYLNEIKQICIEKVGAMPQVAATRDETGAVIELMTRLSSKEYQSIGSGFDSNLFNFTMKNFNVKRKEFCYAGDWSFLLNLETGIMTKCYKNKEFQYNVFENPHSKIPFEAIGCNCKHSFCVNSSHFLSLGTIPTLKTPSYAELRNRPKANWYTDEMLDFLSHKLIEKNSEYDKRHVNELKKTYQNPHLFRKIFESLKQKTLNIFKDILFILFYVPFKDNVCYFISQSIHTNIGDAAIALSTYNIAKEEKRFLKEISRRAFYFYKNQIIKFLNKNDKFFIFQGGGNMGDIWTKEELYRREVLGILKKPYVLISPQTIDYRDDKNKISSIPYYNKSNINICLREETSFSLSKIIYCNANNYLVPDIVLLSKLFNSKFNKRRKDILLIFRNDKEKKISDKDIGEIASHFQSKGFSIRRTDNYSRQGIVKTNRKRIVLNKLKEYQSAKLVVTDRLHGMIFCAITGTPCIVFRNSNQKVKGTFEFIKTLPYVKFVDNLSTFYDVLKDFDINRKYV